MAKNVYIHVPFCKSKCNYCTFVSFDCLEKRDSYLKALKEQINSEYKGEPIKTLYFGGGTPSLLSVKELNDIVELFNLDNTEVTLEVNPDTVNPEYFNALFKSKINRISIGIQTFDDDVLKTIGRRHDSKTAVSTVNAAKSAGFENISIDLIYGLPSQTMDMWKSDLKKAVSLDVQHISLYGLKIEEGSKFYIKMPDSLPDLDIQADMYLEAVDFLSKNGFKHYEISNFAKIGFESKHNLNYWENNSYYGFGPAASGYLNGVRYSNPDELEEYFDNPVKKVFEQKLSDKKILEEAIFLGLRKMEGINVQNINQKFSIDFEQKYSKILKKYLESGHIKSTESGYCLTEEGILVSNEILSEFID